MDMSMMGPATWNVVRNRLTDSLKTVLRSVARITAHIFVGPEIRKSEDWIATSSGVATSIFMSSRRLEASPPLIRSLIALFDVNLWRIRGYHAKARQILLPEIHRPQIEGKRLAEQVRVGRRNSAEIKPIGDMIDWLYEELTGTGADPLKIVHCQLGLSFAAVHTTTNHLTNVLFDLAA